MIIIIITGVGDKKKASLLPLSSSRLGVIRRAQHLYHNPNNKAQGIALFPGRKPLIEVRVHGESPKDALVIRRILNGVCTPGFSSENPYV